MYEFITGLFRQLNPASACQRLKVDRLQLKNSKWCTCGSPYHVIVHQVRKPQAYLKTDLELTGLQLRITV